MKKIFAVLGAALVASAVFADVSVEYTNKLSSDIVEISNSKSKVEYGGTTISDDKDSDTSFAGITNKSAVDFKSDKVDAGITVYVNGNTEKYTKDGNEKTAWLQSWDIDDWYIEFRPINILTLGISDTFYTPGSYLPVEDDNVANGNLGSDYVVVLRPIEGLRIAGGLDNEAFLFNSTVKPVLNFGADYVADIFSVGATFRNVAGGSDNFGFGAYGSFSGLEGFEFTLGYSYNNEAFADVDGNLLSLGVSFGKDALSLAADFVTNFGSDDAFSIDLSSGSDDIDIGGFDLYAGLSAGYQITEALGASVTFTYKTEFDDKLSASVITIEPDVTFAINDNNEIGAGVGIEIDNLGYEESGVKISGSGTVITIPVYWKYTL